MHRRTKLLINSNLNNLTNMPNKRLPGLQKCSKIGCSALCLFRSKNVYCLNCCYGNEHSIVTDFYFDIIQMFFSWEWQQLLDSYLETYVVMLCYAKHVGGTVHRIYLSTTKCTCWYYKRTTSKTETFFMNISAFT